MLVYLPIEGLCSMVATSKTWFMLFSHPDFAFWKQLSARKGAGKFAFTNISLKPYFATHYYLCEFGASFCNQCAMFSGGGERDMVPISVFVETTPNQYNCINPACKARLKHRVGNVELDEVFQSCVKSSRKADKSHTWKSLQRDFRYPDGKPVHEEYQYCARCGLLRLHESYNDSDFCDGCYHKLENCDCEPCPRCGKLPQTCRCSLCNDCGRCEGCARCVEKKKRLCKCTFCDECGGNLRRAGCECL